MKPKRRIRPSLELLEDRWVPTTVLYVAGNLIITNLTGNVTATLTQTAANTFKVAVTGLGSTPSFSGVSNIIYNGSNGTDNVTVDLAGRTYTGSLFINSGNGNDSVILGGAGGGILGGVNVLTGPGHDLVALNSAGTGPVTFGGTIQVTSTGGNDSVALGNPGGPTTVGGDVSLTGVNTVNLGRSHADVLGGNVTVQSPSATLPVGVTLGNGLTINKSLTVNTGAGADTVTVNNATILGNLALSLGEGNNSFNLQGGGVTIGGNTNLTAGNGNNTVFIGTGFTTQGNLNATLGDGNNNLQMGSPGTQGFTVFGNMTLTVGSGNNQGAFVVGRVGGDMFFNTGGGTNSITIPLPPAGTLHWRGRADGDTVGLGLAGLFGEDFNVDMEFGPGDDVVNVDILPTSVLTGLIDGDGRLTANTFNLISGMIGSPFQLLNFPG
jgi:hypothetical protein